MTVAEYLPSFVLLLGLTVHQVHGTYFIANMRRWHLQDPSHARYELLLTFLAWIIPLCWSEVHFQLSISCFWLL